MSNVADDAQSGQPEQPVELSISDVGIIGALARLAHERSKAVLGPRMNDPVTRLVEAFETSGQPGVVIKIAGEVVGRYTVNTTQPRVVVDVENEKALDDYADAHGGMEVIIRRNPTWEKALLRHAKRDEETGQIVDTRTGEVVPGLKYEPGGQATGTVTFTWEQRDTGKNRLLRALQRGDLDHLLRHAPELAAGRTPANEDA